MTGINQYLMEKLSEMGKRTYVAPDIPDKKLVNAINAFKFEGDRASIIGICDNTAFGSAKEGVLITGKKMIYREVLSSPVVIDFEDIRSVHYEVKVEVNKKGKERKNKIMQINKNDGEELLIKNLSLIDLEKLAEVLKGVVTQFDSYKEQSQLQPIEELSEELKIAYLKVIVNMAFDNDGVVDNNEFAEILQLMTRLNPNVVSRNEIRRYIGSIKHVEPLTMLVTTIDEHAPDGMLKSLHISLVKDLINIHASLTKSVPSEFPFLQKNRKIFQVTDDEIELVQMAIANDKKILSRSYTDKMITKNIKELSAKAGAVGVPLGAVYLSGSVIGLSATGITSGLATLGMGGVLGLSSMATGIGAVVVLGVITYKGIKTFAGSGVEEGDKRREIMLQEVIRQSQGTINMVIEDINFLSQELSTAIMAETVNKEQLNQLAMKFSQYINASKIIGKKSEQAEVDKARLRSPELLDLERLKALTKDHEKKQYYDYVISFYRKEKVVEEKDGKKMEREVLRLLPSCDLKEMEQLGQVFEELGYATTQAAIKGKLKGMFKND